MLGLLKDLGCSGFRCRSREEIAASLSISTGRLDPECLQFENEMLVSSHIKFAQAKGVGSVAARNVVDMKKISRAFPSANVFLVLPTPRKGQSSSGGRDSAKHIKDLFDAAHNLGLAVVGIAFRKEDLDEETDYCKILALSKLAIAIGHQSGNADIKYVDIGELKDLQEAEKASLHLKNFLDDVKTIAHVSEPLIASALHLATRYVMEFGDRKVRL